MTATAQPIAGAVATDVEVAALLAAHEATPHSGGSSEAILLSDYVEVGTGLSQAERIANVAGMTAAFAAAVAAKKKLLLPPDTVQFEITKATATSPVLAGSIVIEGCGKGRSIIDAYPKDISPTLSRSVTDAAFTNLSNTMTSVTANFTSADINKVIYLRAGTGIPVTRSIASINSPTSVQLNLPGNATSTGNTIQIGAAASWWLITGTGHKIRLSGFTFVGPDETADSTVVEAQSDSVGLSWAATSASAVLDVDHVEITGKFGTGISRSGGGKVSLSATDINGYNACVAFFGPNSGEAESAELYVSDGCVFTGFDGYANSIGIYVHPCIPFAISDSRFENFNRYGVYQNGSPDADPLHCSITGCMFIDCAGLQTGEGTTLVSNCTFAKNRYEAQQFTLYDDVIFSNCLFDNMAGLTSIGTDSNEITFNQCRFRPAGTDLPITIQGDGAEDTWRFNGCEWFLTGASAAMYVGSAGGKVYIDGGLIDDATSGTSYLMSINGGEVWIRGLNVRNARNTILLQSSTAIVHARDIYFHGAGATSVFYNTQDWSEDQVEGYEVTPSGTAASVFPPGVVNQAIRTIA